jgi:hypothetical protein
MSKAKSDIKQVLIGARALCFREWGQGAKVLDTSARCVVTALRESAGRMVVANRALSAFAAANHIYKHASERSFFDAIIEWNDMAGRTQAEVLAAFDKAIEAVG